MLKSTKKIVLQNKQKDKEHVKMTKAKTVAGVHTHTHTHTHTCNFIKIEEGRNTFIKDIKMTDYK